MTDLLDVLMIEMEPGSGLASATQLAGAGHRLHRCYPADASADEPTRCVALTGGACPIDRGAIDVALVSGARASDAAGPPPAGVTCARREHLPVVADGSCNERFGVGLVTRAEGSVADACARAVESDFVALAGRVLGQLDWCAGAEGVDPGELQLRLERHGSRLIATLSGPAIDSRRQQVLGVRVYDALRDAGRVAGEVSVAYEQSHA